MLFVALFGLFFLVLGGSSLLYQIPKRLRYKKIIARIDDYEEATEVTSCRLFTPIYKYSFNGVEYIEKSINDRTGSRIIGPTVAYVNPKNPRQITNAKIATSLAIFLFGLFLTIILPFILAYANGYCDDSGCTLTFATDFADYGPEGWE